MHRLERTSAFILAGLCALAAGCERGRDLAAQSPPVQAAPLTGPQGPPRVPGSALIPGRAPTATTVEPTVGMTPAARVANPYWQDAAAIREGKRLFDWYNCSGCHAQGGGGMGPPLIDDTWIYGSAPANLYDTIYEGRPGGMPAFGGRIPEDELWKLVAFVTSLSKKSAAQGGSQDAATAGQNAPAPQSGSKSAPQSGFKPGPQPGSTSGSPPAQVGAGAAQRVGDAEAGRRAIARIDCGVCHVIPGVPGARGSVGPSLSGFARRSYIAGNVPNDTEHLQRWLLDPPSLAPATAMPRMPVTPVDARDMTAYLQTLR